MDSGLPCDVEAPELPRRGTPLPGYHLTQIERGEFGELSKVREEIEEAIDAEEQGAQVMVLQELSDVLLAIKGYLDRYHPTIGVLDLWCMARITERAFASGHRTPH